MTTEEQERIAGIVFQIARLEDMAQDAEDREQLGRASKLRSQARALEAQLPDLRAQGAGR